MLSQRSSLYRIISDGVLFHFTWFDEAAVDEDSDMTLHAFGGDAGGGGYLRDAVAGVANDAGEDDTLEGVEAFDGADDAFFLADNHAAGVTVVGLGVYSLAGFARWEVLLLREISWILTSSTVLHLGITQVCLVLLSTSGAS